jgi:hypothetical protein
MVMGAVFASYVAVSKRLGLAFEGGRIHGSLDGVSVQMWFGMHAVHVGALLPKPAPIDISLATKGLIGKLGNLFGGHSHEIGDAEFDKTFAVKASNLAEVGKLLNTTARRALLDVAAAGHHPAVDAHSVHLRRFSTSAIDDSEQVVEHDFRQAVMLAKVIGDSFGAAE